MLPLNIVEKRKHTLQRMIEDCEVLVLRAPFKSTPFDQMAKLLTKPLLQGATKRFERIGDPMPFEGTSTLLIYQQIPRLSHVSTIPGDAIPVNVQFYNPDTKASLRRIMVDAACFTTEDEKRLLTIYLTLHGAGSLPMVCLYAAPIGGESRAVSSFEFSEPALSAAAPSDCSKRKVRIYLNDMLKPDIPTRGCEFSLVFEDKITGFRWIAPPHSNGEPRAQMPILTIQPAKK
ncbi:MAG: hypothetical protein ACKVS6_16705 [Planctomycetota bacterium]